MLPVVMLVAFVLPFMGVFFVMAVMSVLCYQLTRRRANPFLVTHLDSICNFTEAMENFEAYVIKNGRIRFHGESH